MRTNNFHLTETTCRGGVCRLWMPGAGGAGRFLRRGNAMIMAVALTVLLAMIGSSFVMVTRLDRQSTRNSDVTQVMDAGTDAVAKMTQKTLAESLFEPGEPYVDVNTNGKYDPGTDTYTDSNGNGRYDPPGNLKASLYDYSGLDESYTDSNTNGKYDPGESYTDSNGNGKYDAANHWLASIEPKYDANTGDYVWPQASELDGTNHSTDIKIDFYNPSGGKSAGDLADADGDGLTDSKFRELSGITSPDGKKVLYAVRIVDNCGMMNVNTAWKPTDGQQSPLYRLLRRTGVENLAAQDAQSVHKTLMEGQTFKGNPGASLDAILYQDLLVRDYGWFGLFPKFAGSGSAEGKSVRPFGLTDEMELRYRGTLNSTTDTRLEMEETALWNTIGAWKPEDPTGASRNPTAYRILPYSSTTATNSAEAIRRWYAQITDDRSHLLADELQLVPRAEQRHLMTTYSYVRDLRVRDANNAADTLLDGLGTSQFLPGSSTVAIRPGSPGKYRKVNINTVLRLLKEQPTGDPTNPLPSPAAGTDLTTVQADALQRVAHAFMAAGYTAEQGYQFMANLIDYIDADNVPTVLPVGGQTFYGTERQPFIIEVHNRINSDNTVLESAVELFNPYDQPLSMSGFQLRYCVTTTILLTVELGVDDNKQPVVIPGRASVVYASSDAAAHGAPRKAIKAALKPSQFQAGTELYLTRPTSNPLNPIILDAVRKDDLVKVTVKPSVGDKEQSIWRGIALLPSANGMILPAPPPTPATQPLAQWAWARNLFSATASTTPMLGNLNKVTTPGEPLDVRGVSIPVANRGAVADGAALRYRVDNWSELNRVLLIGNPDLTTLNQAFTGDTFTPNGNGDKNTKGKYDPGDEFDDKNKNGVYDPPFDNRTITEKCFKDVNGQPVVQEAEVRLDLANAASKRLMDRLSLTSRADDRMDNEDADNDNDYTTHPDSLLECRVAGRINVNTASKGVLKTLFPVLPAYDIDPGSGLPIPDATTNRPKVKALTDAQLDQVSDWYARAIIYERQTNGAFTGLGNFIARMEAFNNPVVSGTSAVLDTPDLTTRVQGAVQLPSATPGVLHFGTLVDAVLGRQPVGQFTTHIGDLLVLNDSEERDWIASRMADQFTVRSDTFTAYILIRVKDTERRYVALLDRSNVFLPEAAAQNAEPFMDSLVQDGVWTCEPFTDTNGNGTWDTGEPFENTIANNGVWDSEPYQDLNGNGRYDGDDSGDMAIFDPTGALYGLRSAHKDALEDFDYFDRQYVAPKVVAMWQVSDPR